MVDVLYDIAYVLTGFIAAAPPFPWALVATTLASVPVVLVHELGHALVARRLLGVEVDIAIGTTGKLGQLHLARIRVDLHALGSGGAATFDAGRATARDILLIALAGPLASLVALVPTIALFLETTPGTVAHAMLWATTLGGAFVVALNLIPFKLSDRRNGPVERSDGLLALDALKVWLATR